MMPIKIKLCGKCADLMKEGYRVEPLAMDGKTERCGQCGRRAYTLEYEVTKK